LANPNHPRSATDDGLRVIGVAAAVVLNYFDTFWSLFLLQRFCMHYLVPVMTFTHTKVTTLQTFSNICARIQKLGSFLVERVKLVPWWK
jgi:hypothetical protein